MQTCGKKLKGSLEKHFREAICDIQPDPINSRLENFLEAAPTALALLAEPWWRRMTATRKELFFACADVHLYARILDDAVDEEDAANRMTLLRVQPLYWQAVQTLTMRRTGLARDAFALVCATVKAAQTEQTEPEGWAKKNLHLLLVPLFLAKRKSFFEKYRKHLGMAIALLQAEDELAQGKINDAQTLCNLTARAAGCAVVIARAGWPNFAGRIIGGCKDLLAAMENL